LLVTVLIYSSTIQNLLKERDFHAFKIKEEKENESEQGTTNIILPQNSKVLYWFYKTLNWVKNTPSLILIKNNRRKRNNAFHQSFPNPFEARQKRGTFMKFAAKYLSTKTATQVGHLVRGYSVLQSYLILFKRNPTTTDE